MSKNRANALKFDTFHKKGDKPQGERPDVCNLSNNMEREMSNNRANALPLDTLPKKGGKPQGERPDV